MCCLVQFALFWCVHTVNYNGGGHSPSVATCEFSGCGYWETPEGGRPGAVCTCLLYFQLSCYLSVRRFGLWLLLIAVVVLTLEMLWLGVWLIICIIPTWLDIVFQPIVLLLCCHSNCNLCCVYTPYPVQQLARYWRGFLVQLVSAL